VYDKPNHALEVSLVPKPKVLLITTGGTIASGLSAHGATLGRGSDLLSAMPEVTRAVELDLVDLFTLPSSQIGPPEMLSLSREANQRLASGAYAGCVITHGTDTLEETALFLDLLHASALPLVVTGAMRSGREVGPDGANNLQMAFAVCLDPGSHGRGAMVVLNEQVHAARYVTKTHSKDVATFRSPDAGPLGTVYAGHVSWLALPPPASRPSPLPLRVETITARVDLIKAFAGADGALIEAAVAAGAHGLVIEGMGVGNLPAPMASAAAVAASGKGVLTVLATRCGSGPVAVPRRLHDAGVLRAGPGFNGQKARIILLAGLSAGLGREEIARLLS
jgi:L-asparaginase